MEYWVYPPETAREGTTWIQLRFQEPVRDFNQFQN